MDFTDSHSSTTDSEFLPAGNAHFVGIGGAGMQALASVMLESGWAISGSDEDIEQAEQLSARGIQVFAGHAASNVPASTTVLVRSAAVPETNPEIRWARRLQIPVRSYAEMLGTVSRDFDTLAIAGTHGKSTVTAMIAEILLCAGLDPTVICGAHRSQEKWNRR